MDFTKDISPLFESLRGISLHTPDPVMRAVLDAGNPRLTETEYDNWNGGTTYYRLSIQVPIPVFANVEGNLEPIEKAILERVRKLQRSQTHDFITEVVIEPIPPVADQPVVPTHDSQFWLPAHFRLFVSHVSKVKDSARNLKNTLVRYGISAFVAHEDIKPTEMWLGEIEKALFSMDALAAILSPGFRASHWTEQEAGIAVGRGVLVIPIRYGLDPYGLIGKYQGIQGKGRTVRDVVAALFETLLRNPRTGGRLLSCLVEQFLVSGSQEDALRKLALIEAARDVPRDHLEKIRENLGRNDVLRTGNAIVERVNQLFLKHGANPVVIESQATPTSDDHLPF